MLVSIDVSNHVSRLSKGVLAMPEEGNSTGPADPIELWEKWYDTTSKAWSKSLDGSKEAFVDPFGLYRTWLKSVDVTQEQMKVSPIGKMDPKEIWSQWLGASVDVWRKASEGGADPLGFTTQWLEMMEEARARILAEGNIPADPFTFIKQWYDATSETWAKVIGDIIGTDRFMESAKEFTESYTSFYRTFRRANEEFFRNLQLPTRSDIARVAELVIGLEDKVELIQDTLEDFEDNFAKAITSDLKEHLDQVEMKLDALPDILQQFTAVDGLENRLDQVEMKLDALPATLQQLTTMDSLENRLNQVETKLDTLPTTLQKLTAVDSLENRLSRVENKLDKLLSGLEKNEASEPSVTPKSTNSTRSKTKETKQGSSKD
jgi:polyhydroxyalkanoic acid synthase PhaR subunit